MSQTPEVLFSFMTARSGGNATVASGLVQKLFELWTDRGDSIGSNGAFSLNVGAVGVRRSPCGVTCVHQSRGC